MGRKLVASLGALAVAAALLTAGMGSASAAPIHLAHGPVSAVGGSTIGPAAAYKGYAIATYDADVSSGDTLTQVACPSGTTLTGGGAQIADTDLAVNINGLATDDNEWVPQFSSTSSTSAPTVTYAICVAKVAKLTFVNSTAHAPAGAETQFTVTCPAKTVVLEGGIDTSPSYPPLGVTINSSFPLNSREWVADINNASSDNETAVAHAICAKKPAGYRIAVGHGTTVPTSSQAGDTVTCPSGTVVIGGGGLSHSSSTAVSLSSTYPANSTSWQTNLNNRSSYDTTAVSYAICAKAT